MRAAALMRETLPSLLAGTSRRPLKADGMGVLAAVALTGQALRFERPTAPTSFAVEAEVADARAMLPDELRRPLLRVLGSRSVTEHPAMALAEAFDRLRLRPHPFDLPRMDGFVKAQAERLGATARHWARPQAAVATASSYFDPEVIDEANWALATPARRAAFLEQRRRVKPDAARGLLEAAWPNDGAETRLRLLGALLVGLSAADREFLLTLEKDRAPRVRALALRLLARLPGATGENPALREMVSRVERGQTGLLRKRLALKLQLPATVREGVVPFWVRENFAEIGFAEMARAFALDEVELIAACAKDPHLLLGLAMVATADRRLDLLEMIVSEHLPNAWEMMHAAGMSTLETMPAEERQRWALIVAKPYGRKLPQTLILWSMLHRMLDGPAPATLMETVLGNWMGELPGLETHGAQWMELLASLCTPSQYEAMRRRLAAFDTSMTATALPLLDILIAMEKTKSYA